jgi:uncharacterized protein (DUF983 family)
MGKSLFYSIIFMKCPRCREGNMFEKPIFSFQKTFTMYDKYSLEPGFYYGAMFISYILSAFTMFGLFAIVKFGLGMDVVPAFISITIVMLGSLVWFFRISRVIWLHFFVTYAPNKRGVK